MTPTIDSEPSKDGGQMQSGTEETSTSTTGMIKTAGMAVLDCSGSAYIPLKLISMVSE